MTLGTIIFILVSFRRRDLIAYLPPYLILPIGYLFIYLQIYDTTYRLLGNLLFLIGVLAFIIAIYYDYFKTIKKIHRTTTSNPNINKIILSLTPITSLIIGIQIIKLKFELKYSNENINTIINDCVKELTYLADNRHVTLNVNLTTDVYFKLDKYRFPQVLINILSNAIKNTPPKGMVFLTLNETDDYIDIIIKDTGVGLVQEEKKNYFRNLEKLRDTEWIWM